MDSEHPETDAATNATSGTLAADAPDIEKLRALARAAEQDGSSPDTVLDCWAAVRALHPGDREGHLAYAAQLRRMGRLSAADAVLTEAHAILPHDRMVALAWTELASARQDWAAALPRARALEAIAPGWEQTALALRQVLVGLNRPDEALRAVEAGLEQAPGHYWLAHHQIDLLNRLGRHQAALFHAVSLNERHATERLASGGLADALEGLGRWQQAEAVVTGALSRFPGEPWLLLRLARAAARRRDWVTAASRWRAAGLPASGDDEHVRAFIRALCHVYAFGEAEAALVAGRARLGRTPEMEMAAAELAAATGRLEQVPALWPAIRTAFLAGDAVAATLTWRLVQAGLDAAPSLDALLEEPDRPVPDRTRPDWLPAIAGEVLALPPDSPVCNDLRRRLAEAPVLTRSMAGFVASVLLDPPRGVDAWQGVIARAVASGREAVAAVLLDRCKAPAELRVALRLYVNASLARPGAIDALSAEQALVLLALGRAYDPDCFTYLAEALRTRPPSGKLPMVPSAGDIVGVVAHAPLPVELPAARGRARPAPRRLRVALGLYGSMDAHRQLPSLRTALGLEGHDVMLFVHGWQQLRIATLTAGDLPSLLSGQLREAVQDAASRLGLASIQALYPSLLQGHADARLDPAIFQGVFGDAPVVLEDATDIGFASRSPDWLALYKAFQVDRLARQSGIDFDLTLRLRGDLVAMGGAPPAWLPLEEDARLRRLVYADRGYHMHAGQGFASGLGIGTGFMAGPPALMTVAAESFALNELISTGQAAVFGYPDPPVPQRATALALHLQGIGGVGLDVPTAVASHAMDPLSPPRALAAIWKDLRGRAGQKEDGAILRAALADSTESEGLYALRDED